MNNNADRKNLTNGILSLLGEELDIPETKYREAEARYTAIGAWLERNQSSVREYSPEIYVQGSFLLGTVIKPISESGQYDVDSVCRVSLTPVQCSQKELKEMVGREIGAYAKAQNMSKPVDEGNRCWTLNYADGSRFHMDVLPAIPNEEMFRQLLMEKQASSNWTEDAIGITDRTRPDYASRNARWQVSNPKGYARWFSKRMDIVSSSIYRGSGVLMEKYARVEEVPTFSLKTPLQRVIQILKYHRDLMFADDEDKPISVIITTLAAHAYQNEEDLVDALSNIVKDMLAFIEEREGVRWVANPVNPLENFADKWPRHRRREECFYKWHAAILALVRELESARGGLPGLSESITKIAGAAVSDRVLTRYGESMKSARERGTLRASKGAATLGAVGAKVKGHTFFGK